jgi:sterol desaturase/sphingolipid hydroxylase (fatty acid hydroxylase superfamily)
VALRSRWALGLLDWTLWPVLVALPVTLTVLLLDTGVPAKLVMPASLTACALVVALLERLRPERAAHVKLDQSLWIEAAHFFFSFELGYGVAIAAATLAAAGLRRAMPGFPSWPSGWPMALQVALGVLIFEGTSYWQHRLEHELPVFWRFHALHHSGARLNFIRAVRFHAVDIGTATFVAYLPMMLLGASDRLFTVLGVLLGTLGVLQHTNLRLRTPAWLDALVCTPAVHRHHHSILRVEHDRNYGNTVMLFDWLFGTYARPGRPEGPDVIGIEDDPVPRTFVGQVTAPLLGPRMPR